MEIIAKGLWLGAVVMIAVLYVMGYGIKARSSKPKKLEELEKLEEKETDYMPPAA